MTQTQTAQIQQDIQRVVDDLRTALISVYAAVGVDPDQPQEAVRKLGLGKNLAWKLSKIVNATSGFAAVAHMPGASGWELLLRAVITAGASEVHVAAVREAIRAFDASVAVHAGDRSNLELIVDSMGTNNGTPAMELSRQLAFQGLSGIWGVQAKARLVTAFLVPRADDPSFADSAFVGGVIGLRRLRSQASWALFRAHTYDDDGRTLDTRHEEIEPDTVGGVPLLLRRFCSPTLPTLQAVTRQGITEIIQPAGPVGNLGSCDCYFGDIVRRLPRYRDEQNEHAEFGVTLSIPVETLIFDLVLHRSIELEAPPSVIVFGRPMGGTDDPAGRAPENILPLPERSVEVVGRPPALATSLVPRYPEMLETVLSRLGSQVAETRAYRLTMKYPPMSSVVVLRFPLSERP